MTTSTSWVPAVVDEVVPRTKRMNSVFLRAPIGVYQAGQHLDIKLTAADGYAAQRSYSIASAPGAPRVELVIERLEDGEVSPYFFEVAQAGDTLDVRGPIGGHFVWRPEDGGPLLLIAGGSGIAPLLSIVRHWAEGSSGTPVTLLYSARTWDDLAFSAELLALEERTPGFRLVATTTRGRRHRATDYERRVDRTLVHEVLATSPLSPRLVYVCGSTAFVEVATTAVVDEGVVPSRVRTERFGGTG